jgi:hypothetical protein
MPVGNRSNDRVKRKSNTSSSYILTVMAQTTVRDKFAVKILKSCQLDRVTLKKMLRSYIMKLINYDVPFKLITQPRSEPVNY